MQQYEPMQLIRFADLKKMLGGINRITISRWERAGKFPKHLQLGEKTIAWRLNEIEQWLNKRDETF